jgi:hypothetical protein
LPAADGNEAVVEGVFERAIKMVAAAEMTGFSMLAAGVRRPAAMTPL